MLVFNCVWMNEYTIFYLILSAGYDVNKWAYCVNYLFLFWVIHNVVAVVVGYGVVLLMSLLLLSLNSKHF